MKNRSLSCLAALLLLAGCRHIPSERDRETARTYYQLGLQLQHDGNSVGAFKELQRAADLDPTSPEIRNALGVLLHLAFHKQEEAIASFRKALEPFGYYSPTITVERSRDDAADTTAVTITIDPGTPVTVRAPNRSAK